MNEVHTHTLFICLWCIWPMIFRGFATFFILSTGLELLLVIAVIILACLDSIKFPIYVYKQNLDVTLTDYFLVW